MFSRRSFLFLPALFVFLLPVHVWSSPLPALDISSAEFDFGEIFQGDKVEHVFSFRNSGNATLLIDRIKSSCGCTAALLSSKEIAPGAEGTIKVAFDSARFSGPVAKVVFLYSNAPGNETARFTIKGSIKPLIAFNPKVIDFGEVREGDEEQLAFTLTNVGEKELVIQNIMTSNTAYSATTEAKVLPPGVEVLFTVYAKPIKFTPHLRGYVLVRTDNAALGEIRVPVRGVLVRPENK